MTTSNSSSSASSPAAASSSRPLQAQSQPNAPSGLRHAESPPSSPEAQRWRRHEEARAEHVPEVEETGVEPYAEHGIAPETSGAKAKGVADEPFEVPTARTRLLQNEHKYHIPHDCGSYECDHGTMSPRPLNTQRYGSFAGGYFGGDSYSRASPAEPAEEEERGRMGNLLESALGKAVTNKLLGKPGHDRKGSTAWLAETHGLGDERWLYILYYIPFTNWIRQYRWSYLRGDLIAAVTMASFYIPMALSYASNLGHVPPINGLYSFVFNPLIYALLGTCPMMVVGPEAAGSLLTGQVVKEAIKAGSHLDTDGLKNAQVAGMVTGLAGAIILIAGLCRLGFLDGVLSRPFLRGFISAIGIVILVDQLIPEMGLDKVAAGSAASHGSSLDKILFLFRHSNEAHRLTCAVSFSTIAIVMVLREMKKRLQPRMPWVAYLPDRFLVVVLSAVFAWKFDWASQGLDVMGDIRSKGRPFRAHFPFEESNFKHVDDAFSTALIIALLGFFESSVAAKSLIAGQGKVKKGKNGQSGEKGIRNVNLSANRELVALGVANLLGGLFMALPAFGGYGRSKVNASTGGTTPMSSVFLAVITLICILALLPYFYYIPKGVLSAMISVVAYSLIEEAPSDIHFFYSISGYIELTLMLLIFLATFLWNLKIGIAVGIGLSLLRLLRHSTRPRIQILGRVPGTNDFESAELFGTTGQGVEMVPHSLIVKIPEPLTFANTGSLKDRLRRLEDHGTSSAHPALPKLRPSRHNANVIFDVHGVTSLDPAAAQVLLEIVESYVDRGTNVYFCRVPGRGTEVWRLMEVSGIVELVGGERHFLRSVDQALRMTEREGSLRSLADDEAGSAAGERVNGEEARLGMG